MNGLRSLGQRYLLQRIEGEKVLFDLSLVVREYVRTCCQVNEIYAPEARNPVLLRSAAKS
jgi:hypothetical protein